MTARILANQLIEDDEDFDPLGEINRLTTTYPGYAIESEGAHWNVYKKLNTPARVASHNTPLGTDGYHAFIGEITYDDMADMPKESMTPEQIAHWETHHWYAKWGFRDNEHTMCKSFDDAVKAIIAVNGVRTRPVRESEDDPDNPELYLKPDQFTGQPTDQKMESMLRVMLRPYYHEVRVNKRPGLFSSRVGGVLRDSFLWTIHCNREESLTLPSHGNLAGWGNAIDWRKQVQEWFKDWARQHNLHIFKFQIMGRLRKDPTFQFETVRMGPLKEDAGDDADNPESVIASYIDKDTAQEELLSALWKFHPYGTGYTALIGPRGGFVLVTLYFPPDKDDFYKRFEAFVVDWITKRKLFPIKSTKLTGGKHVNSEPYPRWGLTLAINSDWPPDTAPYAPGEVGQP